MIVRMLLLSALLVPTSTYAVQVYVTVYSADCSSGNGYATAVGINGTPPYSFAWSDGSTGPEASLPPGRYTVTSQFTVPSSNNARIRVNLNTNSSLRIPFIQNISLYAL